jgi:hypothetical protein
VTAGGKKYGNTLSFGPINVNGNAHNFDAYFSYPKACKVEKTTFEIVTIKQNGKWVIDDVLYPQPRPRWSKTSVAKNIDDLTLGGRSLFSIPYYALW